MVFATNFFGTWLNDETIDESRFIERLFLDQRGNHICGSWVFTSTGQSRSTYGLVAGKISDGHVLIWKGEDLSSSENDLASLPAQYTFTSKNELSIKNKILDAKYLDDMGKTKKEFVIKYKKEPEVTFMPDEVWESCKNVSNPSIKRDKLKLAPYVKRWAAWRQGK